MTPSSKDASFKDSSKDVEQKQFVTARRGYERHEVRAFLRTVASHLDSLEGQLERAVDSNVAFEEQLARAEQDIRALQSELAEQRLRHREASNRLELCDALREDALARAKSAESARQHAEDLLVQVIQSYRPGQPEPGPAVEAGRPPHDESASRPAGAPRVTDEPRAGAAMTYLLTAGQIRAIEDAAAMPGEMTTGQSARILEEARGNADRINRAAKELAQLWDTLVGEARDDATGRNDASAATRIESDRSPDGEAMAGGPDRHSGQPARLAAGGAPPVRFTTNQARAAAMALHSSARDDLRLAEFWIQEAEQEASEDAIATSRIILEEAHQLLTMAAELGHPAPELLAQYTELDRRTRQPTD